RAPPPPANTDTPRPPAHLAPARIARPRPSRRWNPAHRSPDAPAQRAREANIHMRIALAAGPRAGHVLNQRNPAANARPGPAIPHQANRRPRLGRRNVDRIPPAAAQLVLELLDLLRLVHQPRAIAKFPQPPLAGELFDLFLLASEGVLGYFLMVTHFYHGFSL